MHEMIEKVYVVYSTLPPALLPTLLVVLVPLVVLNLVRVPTSERAVPFAWTAPAEADPLWTSPHAALPSPSISSHLTTPTHPVFPPITARPQITSYDPTTGAFLSLLPALSAPEISERIERAQKAQVAWSKTTWGQRRQVMRSLLEWVVKEQKAIVGVARRDTGKTAIDASFGEILTTCEKLSWTMKYGEKWLKDEKRPTNLLLAHKVSKVRYEALGVVAAVVSWNYPFHNLISPIISSLFAGNAILLKPSELVLWSSDHYIRAIRSCLEACGHDPDLVQMIGCLPDAVEALTGDERIQHITFIGSETVGKMVAIKGAEAGTPVLLELGGKDPCIILQSADIPFFTPTWMRAAFQAAGQNCIGVERFIVATPLYSTFISTMEPLVRSLVLGHDVGAMVSDRLIPRLEELVQLAVKDGARLISGGKRGKVGEGGSWFEPTLLVDVEEGMDIAREEAFAPIMLVMKAYNTAHAIRIANGTRYGLGASVFGRDQKECRLVVDSLKCGMVCTNVFYLNQSLPFGGAASSGHGRFAGPEGLRGLCNLKAITEDRFHGIIQTGIPPKLRYPVKDLDGAKAIAVDEKQLQEEHGSDVLDGDVDPAGLEGDKDEDSSDESYDETDLEGYNDFAPTPWWKRLPNQMSGGISRTLLIFIPILFLLLLGTAGTTHIVTKSLSLASGQYLDPDKVAVIIEKRDLPTLHTVLSTFIARTPPEWPFQIWYGKDNERGLRDSNLLKPHIKSGKLKLVQLPNEDEIHDGVTLSRFLTLPPFWEALAPAKHIFFFQADTVICAKANATVNDFLGLEVFPGTGYDWVGAQWWFRGYPMPAYGGNGGFCIRRRQAMLDITREFGQDWHGENEDLWYAEMIKKTSNQFPEQNVSMAFAFEAPPPAARKMQFVFEPYGVHIGNGGS
ncbi:hypothetical protein P7C70_g2068, partial [Phenoliferia sp. Uapishka_3]